MYSDWQSEAQRCIAGAMKDMPSDATWQDQQAVLRARAHYFHGGTSWGKKVWAKHCKACLALHGKPTTAKQDAKAAPLFAADIVFPFREKAP